MAYICDEKKALFIHIPKTGGTSIKKLLLKNGFRSINLHQALDKSNDNETGLFKIGTSRRVKRGIKDDVWDNYFKFAFVRCPYDRALSNYYFLKFDEKMPFDKFLQTKLVKDHDIWHHELSQTTHVIDDDGDIMMDFVGNFDNLQEDFNIISDKIGLPRQNLEHLNKSHKKTFMLNNENKNIINKKFQDDFVNFFPNKK